jgi:L-lactate dehydrogenase (cytochrome)
MGGRAMNVHQIAEMLFVRRPPAPHGVRRLARCHSIEDIAAVARRRLPRVAMDDLDGGGEDERTLLRNRSAFDDLEFHPQLLRDVSHVDTSTTVLGQVLPMPFVLAPVGAPRLFHHEGELAVARAAREASIPYAISTLSSVPLEAVAAESGGCLWFGLYVWGDRRIAAQLIDRARQCGYRVLLVTADVTVHSKRERELRAGLQLPSPTLRLRTIVEAGLHPSWWWHFLTSDPIEFANLAREGEGRRTRDVSRLFDGTVTWDDVAWIKDAWGGPVVVKGITSVDDACRAADSGADGVIVSNHGGSQLDHLPATIDVLPAIADAVGDRLEILIDSGIRRGSDIVKAIALGARAVLLGRAHLYGLAAAGHAGVAHAIDVLADELRTTMALVGATSLAELDPTLVRTSGRGAATR